MVGRMLMSAAATAVLVAGSQAMAATEMHAFLPEDGLIRIGARESELLSDFFGITGQEALLVRLEGLSPGAEEGGSTRTLGDLHRIELAGTEDVVASLVTRAFSAGLNEQAGFVASADLVELWSRSGELLLSLASPKLAIDEYEHGFRITLDAASAGMSLDRGTFLQPQLSDRSNSGPVSISFRGNAMDDPAGLFTIDAQQLSGSLGVPGRPGAVLAWRVDGLDIDAGQAGTGGPEYTVMLTGPGFTMPGEFGGQADGLRFRTARNRTEATIEIDRLRISDAIAERLFPALTSPRPATSARLLLSRPPGSSQPGGGPISISELTVALGDAKLNAKGTFDNDGQALDVAGRIDGLLAVLQAMGVADPAALAAKLGLLYSEEEISRDSVELLLEPNAQWLRINGKPLIPGPVEQ